MTRRRTIGDDLVLLDLISDRHDRALIQTGSFVEPLVLLHVVMVAANFDPRGVAVGDLAGATCTHHHRAVAGDFAFHPGADNRRLGDQQRHRLPLHVRTHQSTVGIVVLEERNQTCRHTDHLSRCNVHVVDLFGLDDLEVAAEAGDHIRTSHQCSAVHLGVGRCHVGLAFFIGSQPDRFIGDLAILDAAIGGDEETVIVDAGVNRQRTDQTDVRAFRRLNRTDSTVVRNVNIANLETSPLAIQTARAECREPTLVRQLAQRVGLVNDL